MMMAGEKEKEVAIYVKQIHFFSHHEKEKKQAKTAKRHFVKRKEMKEEEEETLHCLYDLFSCYYDT